jgi:hydroxymethylglutaryl-CoA lyase
LKRFEDVMAIAKKENIKVRGYVSCVMGCPYEGEIDPKLVNLVAKKLYEMGCYEISLGDTIGIGTPEKTNILLESIDLDKNILAAHFHNTYNRAIQNLVIALSVSNLTS